MALNRIESFDLRPISKLDTTAGKEFPNLPTKELPLLNLPSMQMTTLLMMPLAVLWAVPAARSQTNSNTAAEPDVLVVSNGDTLHGKVVSVIDGKLTFHTDAFGDITLSMDKVKELRSSQKLAVITDQQKELTSQAAKQLPVGPVAVENKAVTVQSANQPAPPPIQVEHTKYIVDDATLNKEVDGEPSLFSAWSGAATAGATLVAATQNQYSFSGGVGLVRKVPSVDWLRPRNRSMIDFTGSFGKITERSYRLPGPPAVIVPAVTTKTAIYHADAERDQYLTSRVFVLAQVAFDHNFSQNLDLQQIYGGGLGWTAIKTPRQQLDLKGTLQYERQQFISGPSLDLFGSTFSADYILKAKLATYTQSVSYIPAYNNTRAWSVAESNTLAFPMYKNLGFSVGTLDSYLNFPPATLPPTKRNSFQFTMGFTYSIKSQY
jgi:hypothetical protein